MPIPSHIPIYMPIPIHMPIPNHIPIYMPIPIHMPIPSHMLSPIHIPIMSIKFHSHAHNFVINMVTFWTLAGQGAESRPWAWQIGGDVSDIKHV